MPEGMNFVKATLSVTLGACMFAGLMVVSWWERWKGRKRWNFREDELPRLDTEVRAHFMNVILGALPTHAGGKQAYTIVPPTDSRPQYVLFQAQLDTAHLTANLELDYVLQAIEPGSPREHFYLFVHPFSGDCASHYATVAFWYPFPAGHGVEVVLEGVQGEGDIAALQGTLAILGYK
jgi:hypothetical protein